MKVAIFIVSYHRPFSQRTLSMLLRRGVTYPIFVIVADDDDTLEQYRGAITGAQVVTYNREKYRQACDIGDCDIRLTMCSQVRNACFDIACERGFTHFAVLDDDYSSLSIRLSEYTPTRYRVHSAQFAQIDGALSACAHLLDSVSRLNCVCFAQGGDYLGGSFGSRNAIRKSMNFFVFRTDRPMRFVGRLNDDVTANLLEQSRGGLCVTIPLLMIDQPETLSSKGGMSEAYVELGGGFIKSMYTVVRFPSCVRIATLPSKYMRVHHNVLWNLAVPKVISDKWEAFDGE